MLSLGNIFGFYKTRYILLSDGANCTVLRAVVLTQYRRVTDGQTDGNAIASTALAMRTLRRAVKTVRPREISRLSEEDSLMWAGFVQEEACKPGARH